MSGVPCTLFWHGLKCAGLAAVACLLVGVQLTAEEAGRPVRAVFPGYPEAMKAAGTEQAFDVRVAVAASGAITKVTLVDHRPDEAPAIYFAGELLDAVRQWRYPRAPKPRTMHLRFNYRIVASQRPRIDIVEFHPPSEVEIIAFRYPRPTQAPPTPRGAAPPASR